jgi:hypothetical protein
MTNLYKCNKCKQEMEYQTTKYILVEVGGDGNGEPLDIHICRSCQSDIVDFINQPPRQMPKRARDGKFLPRPKRRA